MTVSDKLYVVRLPNNGGSIQCTVEAKARAAFAKNPGSTLGVQPFPSPVKMPRIDGDYTVAPAFDGDGVVATYTPLGVSGWGDDQGEAYSAMLRAIRAHLERETETVIA